MNLTYFFKLVLYRSGSSLLFENKNQNGKIELTLPRYKIKKEIKSAKEFDKQLDKLARLLIKAGVMFINKQYKETAMVHQATEESREVEQIFILRVKKSPN